METTIKPSKSNPAFRPYKSTPWILFLSTSKMLPFHKIFLWLMMFACTLLGRKACMLSISTFSYSKTCLCWFRYISNLRRLRLSNLNCWLCLKLTSVSVCNWLKLKKCCLKECLSKKFSMRNFICYIFKVLYHKN